MEQTIRVLHAQTELVEPKHGQFQDLKDEEGYIKLWILWDYDGNYYEFVAHPEGDIDEYHDPKEEPNQ